MIDRREFLRLTTLGGGAVFASALTGCAGSMMGGSGRDDFMFVQLSDAHWGYKGPANPESQNTLREAVAAVNALPTQPEFIVFTGDLTHSTDDPVERRRRLKEFREIVGGLSVQTIHFMPGEHDASLDRGAAFQELFGPTHYRFEHRGVQFIAIDNVSDPGASVGEEQIAWLQGELARIDTNTPIVVFTHRPLFDLVPKWDWATRDGSRVITALQSHRNVTVFYGHIHQEHHFRTGDIAHHAAKSLIFPLPAPDSAPTRAPLPWDPAQPKRGLGYRSVDAAGRPTALALHEYPLVRT